MAIKTERERERDTDTDTDTDREAVFVCLCTLQLNGTAVENLSVVEARKQIDKSKDKLQLTVARGGSRANSYPVSSFSHHEQPGKLIVPCF